MYGLETSERHPLPCAGQQLNATAGHLSNGTARLVAANSLMAVGRQWLIPRLEGIPTEYRLFHGIDVAAKLAKVLVSIGLADSARWTQVRRDPVRSKYSCGVAVVVLEQASEPLPTTNRARLSWRCSRANREQQ